MPIDWQKRLIQKPLPENWKCISSRPVPAASSFYPAVFDMNRLSPLAKGGVVGVILVLFSGITSFCQTDSLNALYRLEKIGGIQCDFGGAFPTKTTHGADDLEFRVGRNGDFYFIFYNKAKICRFDSTGKFIRSVSTATSLVRQGSGFALGPDGDLFLLDGRGKNLYRYDGSLDLIGNYSLGSKEELEPIFGLVATSWGDLLVAGGLKSNIRKLEPEGRGFSAKPLYLPESHRYSFPFEMEGGKLVATDPLGALMVIDRYGNLLKTFSFRKGLRAAPVGEDYLVTFWPYTEVMILDTVGVVLASWKTAELDSAFKSIIEFQVLQKKAYFLLPSLAKILAFRIVHSDFIVSPERRY